MKTILALAVGFFAGRQIYISYDKKEAENKEKAIKDRLKGFFQENGFTPQEATQQSDELISSKKV